VGTYHVESRDGLIAVFDVGKTNKKFTLFSLDLRPLYTESTRIGEVWRGGLLCDNVEAIVAWVKSVLTRYAGKLSAVAITTYGATVALLDEEGGLVMPVVSYNHEIDPRIREEFYEEFGPPEELYMRTGTPPLGQLLNVGVQLFWVSREYPGKYGRVRSMLFLPQYLAFTLSGYKSLEVTSLGCHTYLYDMVERGWSSVAKGLDVPARAPPMHEVWEPLGEVSGAVITPGIHDSNASLLPYMLAEKGDFVLASTGTWCVLMYPGAPFAPSTSDMRRDILYYVDAFGRPVKAARFKCGHEFDHYVSLIRRCFGVEPLEIGLDERKAAEVIKSREIFVLPTLTPGTGQFPHSKGRVVGAFSRDAREAYYAVNLSLALQTWYAITLLTGRSKLRLIVQGGFAKNDVYLAYLATLMPEAKVIKASYPEATSLGAAITALSALEGVEPRKLRLSLPQLGGERVAGLNVEEHLVQEYAEEFLRLCSEE